MVEPARVICASSALLDSGKAVRFDVEYHGESVPAFVLRYRDRVHGYLNRCAHRPMELDWREGEVFDLQGRDLLCSTHGARYAADSGRCLGGPCSGRPLVPLKVDEHDGKVICRGIGDGR